MHVTVIGAGYVGLTTSVALAHIGHSATCIDVDRERIQILRSGRVPIHEPHLAELLRQTRDRIDFEHEYSPSALESDIILICVGTPPQDNGDADLRYVESAARSIASHMEPEGPEVLVVNKSTVPIGSARHVQSIMNRTLRARPSDRTVLVASNPEFLREGAALYDTLYPDRVLVGAEQPEAINRLRNLYAPILEQTFVPPLGLPRPDRNELPPLVTTSPTGAELAKYASNVFLAMKVSYANEIAGVADRVGADITEIMRAVGLDKRIGPRYLGAGAGWGGSCFGKDLKALVALGQQYGYEMPLANAALRVNERQQQVMVEKVQAALKVVRGATIGLWGLSFKPNTDDLRDSPALGITSRLLGLGAQVKVYDPVAMERAREEHPDLAVEYAASSLEAARGADAVVLVTEWDDFTHVDWAAVARVMRQRIVIDGRNTLDKREVEKNGFEYIGVGR